MDRMQEETKKPMSVQIRGVSESLRKMAPRDRIQLLVKAGLMTQEQAEKAKSRYPAEGQQD